MPATIIPFATVISVMWIIAFSSWRLRNWRASGVLVLGTAGIVAASLLPSPIAPLLAGILWVGFTLYILARSEDLSVVPRPEYSFIVGYVALLKQIADLKLEALSIQPSTYVSEFEGVIDELEKLKAPSPEWAELRADMVRELRRRSAMMRLGSRPSPDTMDRANAAWASVEDRFQQMLKARKRFWAGLPRPTKRA